MPIIIYADFTDLLSLVASLRADALIDEGLDIEWRAVVREPTITVVSTPRDTASRREVSDVAECWHETALPGEPVDLPTPSFVPNPVPPVAAYAEAVGAGVADHVRYLLFSSYWRERQDIGNPDVLRRLLALPILHGRSEADVLRQYGYAVAINGGPITTGAWRLMRDWECAWRGLDNAQLPVVVEGEVFHSGHDAIRRLGTLGEATHTFAVANPYPLPPMPVAAQRRDLSRPGLRPMWRDR